MDELANVGSDQSVDGAKILIQKQGLNYNTILACQAGYVYVMVRGWMQWLSGPISVYNLFLIESMPLKFFVHTCQIVV